MRDHRTPDRIPVDFGGCPTTGMHVSGGPHFELSSRTPARPYPQQNDPAKAEAMLAEWGM